jgi:hypothetical protein
MPGLVPGIHVLGTDKEDVDGRDKPGHDGCFFSVRPADVCMPPHGSQRLPDR